jgi:PAS domain S-box-containing protein
MMKVKDGSTKIDTFNDLLQSQINYYFNNTFFDGDSEGLFQAISDSYDSYEKDSKALKYANERQAHLEVSQQIAHIGSWELILEDTEHINNNTLIWSDETYRILGYDPQSIKPSALFFFKMMHPDDLPSLHEALIRGITEGIPYNLVVRIILNDGEEKIIQTRSVTTLDPVTGRPVKLSGTIQDITDRKKAEEQLNKANHELRTLFNNMQEAFFSIDITTMRQLQMSPACEDIYGYPRQAFIENPNLWHELILEEDKPLIEVIDRDLYAGKSSTYVYRVKDKNGKIKWLESRLTPTLKEGTLVRIDGTTADITKRKEAEIALRDSEYRFRCIIQHSFDAIYILNEKAEIIFSSDSIYRITGYKPEEVTGIPAIEFVHPDYKKDTLNTWNELLEKPGETRTLQYKRLKKNAGYIWCEGVFTNLMHEPAVKGMVINFRDITERISDIEALKATNEDLKKSNMELDRFVYSVSHDLRAPLSSMLGVLQLVQSEVTEPAVLSDLDLLEGSIKKLDSFILDILDYSKNSRLDQKREEIHFRDIVKDVLDHLKYMGAGTSNIDIKVSINEEFILYSDRGRINIILNNLISNAIRYSNPSSLLPFVHIDIKTTEQGARISVKDNGIGINKENHLKVFDIFYRVASNSLGSGLGLYIVKEAVSKLNGTVSLLSAAGEGSEFIIYIPNS